MNNYRVFRCRGNVIFLGRKISIFVYYVVGNLDSDWRTTLCSTTCIARFVYYLKNGHFWIDGRWLSDCLGFATFAIRLNKVIGI